MREPPRPPSLEFALACFGSALSFLLVAGAGLVWVAPDLAAGWFPLPRVVAVVHLFTLGWITLSMIAALHHFVPVALHVPLMPARAAWLQLAVFNLGLGAFTAGELLGSGPTALGGAALVGLALLAFALFLAAAMLRARRARDSASGRTRPEAARPDRQAPARRGGEFASERSRPEAARPNRQAPDGARARTAGALLAAAFFLAVLVGAGVVLASNRVYGWAAAARLSWLALHVGVALLGWVLLVLVAVGQRLLPMFLLAPAPGRRLAAASLLLIAGGALALLPLHRMEGALAWLPLVPAALGLAVFLVQAAASFRHAARRPLDPGLRLAGAGLVFLALAICFAPLATGSVWQRPQPLVALVAAVVLGTVTLFIAGHYYRIVPFLVWSNRWAAVPPSPAGPRAPDALYRRPPALVSLMLLVAGAAIVLVGLGFGLGQAARLGAVTFASGTAALAWQMLRVMTSRPV